MRILIYLGIVVVAIAAQGARAMHGYWPHMSRASFDVWFALATALFVLLLGLGARHWNHPHWRDWEAWCALLVVLYGLANVMLPLVQ